MKSTFVDVMLIADFAAEPEATGVPQPVQKFDPLRIGVPQVPQVAAATGALDRENSVVVSSEDVVSSEESTAESPML